MKHIIMKFKIALILFGTSFFLLSFSQNKINGTYLFYNGNEYMQINKDTFKIFRCEIYAGCFDLDKGDSLLSIGSITHLKNDLFQFQNSDLNQTNNDISVYEYYDPNTYKDSLKIKFVFPYNGRFRINANIRGYRENTSENDSIIIKRNIGTFEGLVFSIYNLDLVSNGDFGDYFGRIAYTCKPSFRSSNKKINSLVITIPDLTNSYFARYFINGEIVKINNKTLIWRYRRYEKWTCKLLLDKKLSYIHNCFFTPIILIPELNNG